MNECMCLFLWTLFAYFSSKLELYKHLSNNYGKLEETNPAEYATGLLRTNMFIHATGNQ